MVADESRIVRNAKLLGEPKGRVDAGVRYRDDHVGLYRMEACQFAAHVHAHLADGRAAQTAVGACKVDVLKDAEGLACGREGELGAEPALIDDHDLARLQIPDEFGADQVKGACLRGEHPGIVHLAQGERAEAVGIADTDDLVLSHDDEGEGSLKSAERPDRAAHRVVGLGQQMEDDLAVDGGLEDGTAALEFGAQGGGIDQIAVVGDGELAACRVNAERLRVE